MSDLWIGSLDVGVIKRYLLIMTTTRPAAEIAAHSILLTVLRVKSAMERIAFCAGTLRRADSAHLLCGLDWALERGLIQYGSNNASAKAWHRLPYSPGESMSDQLLYLTKAGRKWLRDLGTDYGSGMLYREKLAILRASRMSA